MTMNEIGRDPSRYRANVGLAVFGVRGLVFLGRRSNSSGPHQWQMPQGGVDAGESPAAAAVRELREEIGVSARLVDLLEETPDWLYYDFPLELMNRMGGRYLGQRQKWFAFRFKGRDSDIRLDLHTPEFDAWRWASLDDAARSIVPFKQPVYREVALRFAKFSASAHSLPTEE
jgi:putative (di)nucleoside polyphosphate hydrolase